MPDLLEQLLVYCREKDRICPLPQQWSRFFQLLTDSGAASSRPLAPLILAAWDTQALFKMIRLKEQIEWAAKHGSLDIAAKFLHSLLEEEWLHLGE